MSSGLNIPDPNATGPGTTAAGAPSLSVQNSNPAGGTAPQPSQGIQTSAPAGGTAPQGIQTSTPAGGPPPQPSSGIQTVSLPASYQFISGDPLYTVLQVNDHSWPATFILDRDQANWNEWSHRLKLLCKTLCLLDWLDPTFVPPDAATDARGHRVYSLNDQSLTGFILRHISQLDYKAVWELPTSRAVYAELRRRHEKLGSHAQILLIEKVMKIEFCPGTRIAQTWDEIDTLIEKIKAIGPLDYDQLKTAIAIKALGRHYEHLQSHIQSITKQPNFSVADVASRLLQEDDHIRNREDQGLLPSSTAFAAQTPTPGSRAPGSRPRPTCSHCKRTGHLADFCIQPGGKMAGRTVEDAMAAYRAFKRQQRTDGPHQPSSANVAVTDSATSTSVTTPSPFVINGVHYAWVPVPSSTPVAPATDTAEALSALSAEDVLPIDSEFDFHCGIAESEEFHVSINWDRHSDTGTVNDGLASSVALTATQVPIKTSFDSPFFVDTGANTHLSPVLSDFKTLRPILPHPISGVGGSYIHAVGIGTDTLPKSR